MEGGWGRLTASWLGEWEMGGGKWGGGEEGGRMEGWGDRGRPPPSHIWTPHVAKSPTETNNSRDF